MRKIWSAPNIGDFGGVAEDGFPLGAADVIGSGCVILTHTFVA